MVIESRAPGYARGRLIMVYMSSGSAVPVIVTPDSVTISAEDESYRITLGRAEVDSIYRATYGVDWEKPE